MISNCPKISRSYLLMLYNIDPKTIYNAILKIDCPGMNIENTPIIECIANINTKNINAVFPSKLLSTANVSRSCIVVLETQAKVCIVIEVICPVEVNISLEIK